MDASEPKESNTKAPVICKLKSRYGNQLFQYWIARKIADDLGRPLHVCVCTGDVFVLTQDVFPNVTYDLLYEQHGWCPSILPYDHDWVSHHVQNGDIGNEPIVIDVYSESYAFVSKYKDSILKYYTSTRFAEPENRVAIHVRLGDLAAENVKVTDYIDYCVTIAKDITQKEKGVSVLIISEEPKHAFTLRLQDELQAALECQVSVNAENGNVHDDFFALRNSRFVIMQNSTFSWWAGFLADPEKTTVYAYACGRLGCGFRNETLFRPLSPDHFVVKHA